VTFGSWVSCFFTFLLFFFAPLASVSDGRSATSATNTSIVIPTPARVRAIVAVVPPRCTAESEDRYWSLDATGSDTACTTSIKVGGVDQAAGQELDF
jgi:hypothetical protein